MNGCWLKEDSSFLFWRIRGDNLCPLLFMVVKDFGELRLANTVRVCLSSRGKSKKIRPKGHQPLFPLDSLRLSLILSWTTLPGNPGAGVIDPPVLMGWCEKAPLLGFQLGLPHVLASSSKQVSVQGNTRGWRKPSQRLLEAISRAWVSPSV